jgi:hypothetical protein
VLLIAQVVDGMTSALQVARNEVVLRFGTSRSHGYDVYRIGKHDAARHWTCGFRHPDRCGRNVAGIEHRLVRQDIRMLKGVGASMCAAIDRSSA